VAMVRESSHGRGQQGEFTLDRKEEAVALDWCR